MLLYATAPRIDAGAGTLVVAGLLVGLGTSYGSGCTSGHGVCGISRLSPRSLVATAAFMAAGVATVYLARHFTQSALAAFTAGLLFGIGLILGGMTDRARSSAFSTSPAAGIPRSLS